MIELRAVTTPTTTLSVQHHQKSRADRILAATLLDEASSAAVVDPERQEKVDKELAKAQEELDKGDAERGGGKFGKAIDHYEKAWEHAGHAGKEAAKGKEDEDE